MTTDASKNDAVELARDYLARNPVYLDTETTGLNARAEIVEISVIDSDGTPLIDSLVRPLRSIPADATAVHGINMDMVRDAPDWGELWPRVLEVLKGRHIGIYNADFDLRMMQQAHTSMGMRWQLDSAVPFCIMKLYAKFYGEINPYRGSFRWQSLEKARKQLGLSLPNSHRSLDDTLLTREVLLRIGKRPETAHQATLPGMLP
jgi:DNA polymerase III subunit epsilon